MTTAAAHSSSSNQLTAGEIRRRFVAFFEARGHTFTPSSPVVPLDDPTLLFTNAGMNQFKPVFLGDVPAGSPLAGLTRAVNSQKCIRAGGKHNDLDDVGKDSYHHTFFEMLGNWSFGDYFKAEAIDMAWNLLTQEFGLDPERLYATYFEGDPAKKLEPDSEARDLWLRHLPKERVLPGDYKDNFWEMGDTGPCGPCSELHYDRVGGRDAAALVNKDDPDVIEVWNLVFIQFDRTGPDKLRPLPAKHVDTGMGLERLVSVLQDVRSNYDTDIFRPIFDAIQKITGARPYAGRFGAEDEGGVDTAYRVIADHIRTLTFAITDGALPSNEGRGYVLRRVLRRAVVYGYLHLKHEGFFFHELVAAVVANFGEAFPELKRKPAHVEAVINDEEASFGRTLDRGVRLFLEAASRAMARSIQTSGFGLFGKVSMPEPGESLDTTRDIENVRGISVSEDGKTVVLTLDNLTPERVERHAPGATISGADAFQLYDTYGFPLDLTVLMAEERGLKVDVEGFAGAMAEQKERSRQGAKTGDGPELDLDVEAIDKLRTMSVAETDDSFKFDAKPTQTTLRAIWNGEDFDLSTADNAGVGRPFVAILDKTPFYAEMGGQLGDTGVLDAPGGDMEVTETKVFGGFVAHFGAMTKGTMKIGDRVEARVDRNRRHQIEANHTATHLLNHALRKVVGEESDQRGSLVAPDRLRFDFAASGVVAADKLAEVDKLVTEAIERDMRVHAAPAPLGAAQSVNGLRAVFGERYPDPVRVVAIGPSVEDLLAEPDADRWPEFSIEFCGGTHLSSTGEAKAFCVISEEAVAKGIRRVTALTGHAAVAAQRAAEHLDWSLEEASKHEGARLKSELAGILVALDEMTVPAARAATIRAGVKKLQEKLKSYEKEIAKQAAVEAQKAAAGLAEEAAASGDPFYVSAIHAGSDRGALQAALGVITAGSPSKAVMLLSPDEAAGRAAVAAAVPKDLTAKLKAGDWVREVAGVMGGKGGGKPDSAQGSGADLSKLDDALAAAARFAAEKLG